MPTPRLSVRLAQKDDLMTIEALTKLATRDLLGPFLDPSQQIASMEFTALDPWLIEDQTYFVIEIGGLIRASGGWSFRDGLMHTKEPVAPTAQIRSTNTACLRAMYTDPAMARKGIGRMVVAIAETSARLAGYTSMELLATPVGKLLYQGCGYAVLQDIGLTACNGATFNLAYMAKDLQAPQTGHPSDRDSRTPLRHPTGITD